MIKRTKLCILYGGPGDEHEVSVKSAQNILANVDLNKYELKEVFLRKNTKILSHKLIKELKNFLVWPIFHGEFGEGGYVQEVLEKNKIRFIGSSSKVSKLVMDKFETQKVLEKNNIACPKTLLLDKTFLSLNNLFSFPLILKPVNSGSSVDVHKVKHLKELEIFSEKLLKKYKQILLQEFISGREFTCGVINFDNRIVALPVSEVVLDGQELFDYKAKYDTSGLEITPAKVSIKIKNLIQHTSKKVHNLLGCQGFSRTDMILDKHNKLFVLEINTIPGLTKVSFIPEQLKSARLTISEFIDIVVQAALR